MFILFLFYSFVYSNNSLIKSHNYNDLYLFNSKNISIVKTYKKVRNYTKPAPELSIAYSHFLKFMPIDFYKFALSVSYLDVNNLLYLFTYDFISNAKYLKLAYCFFFTDRGKRLGNVATFFGAGVEFSKNTYLFPQFGIRLSRRSSSKYLGVNFDISYEYRNSQSKENRFLFSLGFFCKI